MKRTTRMATEIPLRSFLKPTATCDNNPAIAPDKPAMKIGIQSINIRLEFDLLNRHQLLGKLFLLVHLVNRDLLSLNNIIACDNMPSDGRRSLLTRHGSSSRLFR